MNSSLRRACCAVGVAACMAALAVTTGCQTLSPFPEPPPFGGLQKHPEAVPQRFHRSLAPQFEEQSALVFHYRWMDMAAVGVAAVDRETRSLAVTCMTPLGVKIFEVVCTNGILAKSFVMPALEEKAGPLVSSAGTDMMRAYFDLIPPGTAEWHLTKTRLVFTARDPYGVTEYRYAWEDGKLAEKIRIEKGDTLWCVEYRTYAQTPAGLIPTGLMIRNQQRGYCIEVSRCEEENK